MTVKSAAWYYRFPGHFYAMGPARYDKPVTERKVRADLRRWWKFKRLPRGTELWTTK